jgi:hypothetical protein
VKIGTRAGIQQRARGRFSRDPLGKRCVCRCSACGRTFVVGAAAFASGGVHCGCTPLSAEVRDRNGQALAHVYFESEPGRRAAANLLAKLRELLRQTPQ